MSRTFARICMIALVCFVYFVLVQYWQPAASIPIELQSTLIVIGLSSIFLNLFWLLWFFLEQSKHPRLAKRKGFTIFIAFIAICQAIYFIKIFV